MNKSCEYCQYNGAYASIINPCEDCPNNYFMINGTFPIVRPLRETTDHVTNTTYITATTGCKTNSNGAKINDVFTTDLTTDLPTADEYRKSIGVPYYYQCEWSEPKYIFQNVAVECAKMKLWFLQVTLLNINISVTSAAM